MSNGTSQNVSVQSVPSTKPPANVPQTKLLSVRLLLNSGKGVPAFNQGPYHDKLPVQNAKNNRTIQSSGCGLCAWACLVAAAGCRAPSFTDEYCNQFGSTSDASPAIDPSNFL